ncbi:hypothetical protein [Nocardiopsis nanhaiensis]
MNLRWEGEEEDLQAARRAAAEHEKLVEQSTGTTLSIANEFSEITVRRVETRNGARLLIEAPRSGQWVALCPLELEALTWQSPQTFSAMVGTPFEPMIGDDE